MAAARGERVWVSVRPWPGCDVSRTSPKGPSGIIGPKASGQAVIVGESWALTVYCRRGFAISNAHKHECRMKRPTAGAATTIYVSPTDHGQGIGVLPKPFKSCDHSGRSKMT